MTPIQIIEYGMAFMVVSICVFIAVCALAVTIGCVRANCGKNREG